MDWKELIFFLSMLCLFRPKLTSCCKCPGPEHPQWLYCKSDIVIKAYITNITRVYSKQVPGRPIGNHIHVHIYQKFKGERKFKNIDHTKIYTPLGCNIRPRIGRKYIMMGVILDNEMRMTKCNFMQLTHTLTKTQQLGLRKLYKKNCRCIADIGTDSPYHLSPKDPGFRGCTSRKSKLFDVDCYVNHAVCVYRKKTCQWKGKFRKKARGK